MHEASAWSINFGPRSRSRGEWIKLSGKKIAHTSEKSSTVQFGVCTCLLILVRNEQHSRKEVVEHFWDNTAAMHETPAPNKSMRERCKT